MLGALHVCRLEKATVTGGLGTFLQAGAYAEKTGSRLRWLLHEGGGGLRIGKIRYLEMRWSLKGLLVGR